MSDFQPEGSPSQPAAPGQVPATMQAQQAVQPPPPYAQAQQAVQPPPPYSSPAYGQPQQAMPAATMPVAYVSTGAGRPWILAALAGIVVGAIAAFLYAAISFAIDKEFLLAVVAIGMLIGFTVRKVSGRPGLIGGIIAVVIAAAATLAAIVMLMVFAYFDSIPEGLKQIGDVPFDLAIRAYFHDFLAYVWFAASLIVAFIGGRKASA